MDEKTRFSIFMGIFIIISLLELIVPQFHRREILKMRWLTNIGLSAFNVAIGALLFVHMAKFAFSLDMEMKFGLFHKISLPIEIEILLSILLLDFAIYLQHIATHKIPILWKLHQVHHHDLFLDTTSGIRFHTIEIILSYLYKLILVLVLGLSIRSLIIFEILLNGSALFNHGNFRIPHFLNTFLKFFIVTPQMHRIHHSPFKEETDSNYGFFFSFWDRIFKTFVNVTKQKSKEMKFGIEGINLKKDLNLWQIICLPFKDIREQKT